MDIRESFFRARSRRRSRPMTAARAMKGTILLVFFSSAAAAIFLIAAGLPK